LPKWGTMQIRALRKNSIDGRVRVSASMIWEDCDRPSEEVYFECPKSFEDDIDPNPNALLLAGIMPAADRGERRVQVEGPVCPELRNGLLAAFRVIRDWYPQWNGPVIESTVGFHPSVPRTPSRVATFMSAGVDSLATLRCNRLDYPLNHPASVRDCFFFLGFNRHDFDANGPVPERLQDFETRLERMSELAHEAQINLIPVHTNIRFFSRDPNAWNARGMGAGLASVAHAFTPRIARVLIGSFGSIGIPFPWGTHPLLDPNFSSTSLEVRHDGLQLSRLQKTAIISEWPAAMRILQCCWQNEGIPTSINCGRCGKCRRTMIQLAALDRLDKAHTFPHVEITPQMIDDEVLQTDYDVGFFQECIEHFAKQGRADLVEAIHKRINRHHDKPHQAELRTAIKRWDEKMTHGLLTRAVQSLRGLLRKLRK
jgi:hypothetical protein